VRKVDDIMSDNAKKDDVVVVGGREFKRVKNGLDEAQVAPFIDELTKERDKLAQSQDHIASLNRLAEMAVVEADKLAAQIKTEAEEQAKAEGTAIIDKAKEQARQIAEQKIAEAVEIANEKAKAIQTKAEEEAALMLENERNKIRSELHNLVNQQFGYMLEELESLKKQAAAVQADFDNKLAKPGEENSAAATEIAKESDAIAAKITEESDAIAAKIAEESAAAAAEIAEEKDTAAAEITEEREATVAEEKDTAAEEITEEREATVAEEKDTAVEEITEEREATVAEESDAAAAEIAEERDTKVAAQSKAPDEHPEPSQTADYIEKSLDLSKLFEGGDKPDLGNPQWEVEILPPFNIGKIMEVVSFLDQLPEVANTEMIVPQIDMPSILVFLHGPMNLVDVLQTVPVVAHVEEVTTDKAATNGESGKEPRKVRISLSENTTAQEKK
jgi:chemotaxis protein histidine kinase CheA